MHKFLVLLALVLVGCGTAETPAKEQAVPTKQEDVLGASLRKYRAECRKARKDCEAKVEIDWNQFFTDGTLGRCDAFPGDTEPRKIWIAAEAKNWPQEMLDLVVAHEAEHCVRGVVHNESGDAVVVVLMRPNFLTKEEATQKSYSEWLKESFKAESGDPSKL